MIREMECLSYKRRLEDYGLFSLSKMKSERGSHFPLYILWRGHGGKPRREKNYSD